MSIIGKEVVVGSEAIENINQLKAAVAGLGTVTDTLIANLTKTNDALNKVKFDNPQDLKLLVEYLKESNTQRQQLAEATKVQAKLTKDLAAAEEKDHARREKEYNAQLAYQDKLAQGKQKEVDASVKAANIDQANFAKKEANNAKEEAADHKRREQEYNAQIKFQENKAKEKQKEVDASVKAANIDQANFAKKEANNAKEADIDNAVFDRAKAKAAFDEKVAKQNADRIQKEKDDKQKLADLEKKWAAERAANPAFGPETPAGYNAKVAGQKKVNEEEAKEIAINKSRAEKISELTAKIKAFNKEEAETIKKRDAFGGKNVPEINKIFNDRLSGIVSGRSTAQAELDALGKEGGSGSSNVFGGFLKLINHFGGSKVTGFVNGLNSAKNEIAGVATEAGVAGGRIGLFGRAFLGAGYVVGAAALAVYAFGKALQETIGGLRLYKVGIEVLSQEFGLFLRSFNPFSQDFGGFFSSERREEVATNAAAYANAIFDLRIATIEYTKAIGDLNAAQKIQQNIQDDTTRSIKERTAATKENFDIQKKTIEANIAQFSKQLDVEKKAQREAEARVNLGGLTDKQGNKRFFPEAYESDGKGGFKLKNGVFATNNTTQIDADKVLTALQNQANISAKIAEASADAIVLPQKLIVTQLDQTIQNITALSAKGLAELKGLASVQLTIAQNVEQPFAQRKLGAIAGGKAEIALANLEYDKEIAKLREIGKLRDGDATKSVRYKEQEAVVILKLAEIEKQKELDTKRRVDLDLQQFKFTSNQNQAEYAEKRRIADDEINNKTKTFAEQRLLQQKKHELIEAEIADETRILHTSLSASENAKLLAVDFKALSQLTKAELEEQYNKQLLGTRFTFAEITEILKRYKIQTEDNALAQYKLVEAQKKYNKELEYTIHALEQENLLNKTSGFTSLLDEKEQRAADQEKVNKQRIQDTLAQKLKPINDKIERFSPLFGLGQLSKTETEEFAKILQEKANLIKNANQAELKETIDHLEKITQARSAFISEQEQGDVASYKRSFFSFFNIKKRGQNVREEALKDQIKNKEEQLQALGLVEEDNSAATLKAFRELAILRNALADEQAEKERQRTIEAIENIQRITDAVAAGVASRNAKVNEEADYQIRVTQNQLAKQRSLAERGIQQAGQNVATEEAILDKQELSRKERLERQRAVDDGIRLGQIFAEAVLAGLKNGDSIGRALLQGFTVAGLTKAAQLTFGGGGDTSPKSRFYEGTKGNKTVGDMLGYTGTKDGHNVSVDDNERIFNPSHTAMLGSFTNEEVANMALNHKKGYLPDYMMDTGTIPNDGFAQNVSNSLLVKEMQAMKEVQEKSLKALEKMPTQNQLDLYYGLVQDAMESAGKPKLERVVPDPKKHIW